VAASPLWRDYCMALTLALALTLAVAVAVAVALALALALTLTLSLALALTRRDYCKALEATLCEVCAPTLTLLALTLNPKPSPTT